MKVVSIARAGPLLCLAATLLSCASLGGHAVHVDAPDTETTLPGTTCGDYHIIDAMLDGTGPYRLQLDTGTPRTLLTPETARRAGIRKHIRSIEAGGFRASGRIPVRVRELAHIGHALGTEIDGVIGYTVFDGTVLVHDYPRREVRVRWGALPPGPPGTVAMRKGPRPFIRARFGDDTLPVLVDSGYNRTLKVGDLSAHGFKSEPVPVSAAMRFTGLYLVKSGRYDGDVDFGAFTLNEPVISGGGTGTNLLGQQVLRHFVVSLDQRNGRVRFQHDGGAPLTVESPPRTGLGAAWRPAADHLELVAVFDGSAAEAAGLEPGDRLVEYDGESVAELGCRRQGDAFRGTGDVELVIEREQAELRVWVTPSVLVE